MQNQLPLTAPERSHLVTLDGFRGVAALAVVAFHILNDLGSPLGRSSAYLAVDFFFALSGYVMGLAYERKIQTGDMSVRSFVRARLIRLYPLIFLGAAIGILWRLDEGRFSIASVAVAGIFAFLLLPLPRLGDPDGNSFPINGPGWSLTYEILANVMFALGVRRLSNRVLVIAIAFSCLVGAGMAYANNGLDASTSWGAQPAAFMRTVAPFLIGIMLYRRFGASAKPSTLRSLVSAALLIALLSAPKSGYYYDIICAYLVFPLCIVVGRCDPAHTSVRKLWSFLGSLSYPVYALNLPLIFFMHQGVQPLVQAGSGGMLLAFALEMSVIIAVGYAALKFYDMPLRRWLNLNVPGFAWGKKSSVEADGVSMPSKVGG